jgi:hypothetical protein
VVDDPSDGDSPNPGNPAGFIAYHISIGTSARGALSEWRDIGGTSGDKAWYTLYGQVNDTIMRTDDQASLDPTVLPSPSDYGTWSMGNGGQYATQVSVTAMDVETGLRSQQPFTYVTDEPHTPEEAEAAAMDEYGTDDNEARYGQVVTGAFTTHVWQTEPFGA